MRSRADRCTRDLQIYRGLRFVMRFEAEPDFFVGILSGKNTAYTYQYMSRMVQSGIPGANGLIHQGFHRATAQGTRHAVEFIGRRVEARVWLAGRQAEDDALDERERIYGRQRSVYFSRIICRDDLDKCSWHISILRIAFQQRP